MDFDHRISRCRACGNAIRWVITARNKKMPCDPGACRFFPGGGPETFVVAKDGRVIRGKRDKRGTVVGYISHFATCPESDRFRTERRAEHG